MVGDDAKFGILTISDRANAGEYQDEGGPAILGFFEEAIASSWSHHYKIVPDEIEAISNAIIHMTDELNCDVVVTTGGTGPAERDVTPEATELVCDRILPGSVNRCEQFHWRMYPLQFYLGNWVGPAEKA